MKLSRTIAARLQKISRKIIIFDIIDRKDDGCFR